MVDINDTHGVISAFLDDEPFDARKLAQALSDPAGRDLLIDLVALRSVIQSDDRDAPALRKPNARRAALQALVAVAAVLIALVGGYLAGERRGALSTAAAPPASRVVQAPAAWQDLPVGRMQ